MELNLELSVVVLFVGMVLSAALTFYFSLRIMRATRGSNYGWLFYALFGMANSINSVVAVFRATLTDSTAIKTALAIQSITIFALTFFIVLGVTILAEVFGVSSKVFSKRNVLVSTGIVLIVLMAFNLSSFSVFSMYSAATLFLVAGLLLSFVPLWNIMVATNRLPWKLLVISRSISIIALYMIIAVLGCCAYGGVLEGQPECPGIMSGSYMIIPAPCSGSFAELFGPFLMFLLIGTWIQTGAFYSLYRRLI